MRIDSMVPGVSHEVSEDGLWIVSKYRTEKGTAESTVGWDDLDTAVLNYVNAARSFEARIPKLEEKIVTLGSGTNKSKLKRFKHVDVYRNFGPPVWWRPRANIGKTGLNKKRWELRFGWLLWAFSFTQRKNGDA